MKAACESYARYWREAFRLPSMDLAAVADRLDKVFIGAEHFAQAHRAAYQAPASKTLRASVSGMARTSRQPAA